MKDNSCSILVLITLLSCVGSKYLCAQGTLVSDKPSEKKTLPEYVRVACWCGDAQGLKKYFKAQGDPNIHDTGGLTMLSRLCAQGHNELVLSVLWQGADPNVPDVYGKTPLMWAAYMGNAGAIDYLVQNNVAADLDATDVNGKTALMYAAQKGHVSIVEKLLLLGANVLMKDIKDRTASDFAKKRNFSAILKLLKQEEEELAQENVQSSEAARDDFVFVAQRTVSQLQSCAQEFEKEQKEAAPWCAVQ